MATHVWVNPERFRESGREVEVDGVELFVQLSPFDVPTGIRGRYNEATREFEIRFGYINSETEGRVPRKDGIRFVEGRHSGKLLAVLIPVDKKPLDTVGLVQLRTQVDEALSDRVKTLDPGEKAERPFGQFLNWEAARDVLADEREFEKVAGDLLGV